MTDPRALLHSVAKEYGDPFIFKGPFGPTVITGHPDGARAVFTADPETFDTFGREQMGPFIGETSLLLTAGARHKQDRRLLTPPFHGARMRAYGKIMRTAAEHAAGQWQPGKAFSMLETAQTISLEVILQAIFGVEDEARRARLAQATIRLMDATASPLILMFKGLRRQFGGIGPWARFSRAIAEFDRLVFEEIATRRERAEPREDILSLLMSARYDDGEAMSDKELRDQLHLLVFAGHETTANALAWAFHWLHRQPEERERVLAEIDGLGESPEPDALAALPYLEAVCQETLRIYPVVGEVGRLLRKPLQIMGHDLPAGHVVMVSAHLLHDREDLYPEPRRFLPQRFLSRKASPFELMTFGGGARRCIGAAFGLYEMKIVLATLLRAFRLRLVRDAPVRSVARGLVHGPKGGVRMILEGPR